MRCRRISPLILLALIAVIAIPAADAARPPRYSGTVTALDLGRGIMVLEEVGPWRVERGTSVSLAGRSG